MHIEIDPTWHDLRRFDFMQRFKGMSVDDLREVCQKMAARKGLDASTSYLWGTYLDEVNAFFDELEDLYDKLDD